MSRIPYGSYIILMNDKIDAVPLEPYIIGTLDLLYLTYLGTAGELLIDTVLVIGISYVDIIARYHISERRCRGGSLSGGRLGLNGSSLCCLYCLSSGSVIP